MRQVATLAGDNEVTTDTIRTHYVRMLVGFPICMNLPFCNSLIGYVAYISYMFVGLVF